MFRRLSRKDKQIVMLPAIALAVCLLCLIYSMLGLNDINEYENRTAEKLPSISDANFGDGSFQDGIELGFSDQILFAEELKYAYNLCKSELKEGLIQLCAKLWPSGTSWSGKDNISEELINSYLSKEIPFKENKSLAVANPPINFNDGRYYALTNGLYNFNGHLVALEGKLDESAKEGNLVKSVNMVSNIPGIDVYFYCIERERDINLLTDTRNDNYKILSDAMNISSFNKGCFELESYDMFNELFLLTDHHWNHKGSYIAYCQLMKMLKGHEEVLYPTREYLLGIGQGSRSIGDAQCYTEYLSVYEFDYPNYSYMVDGKELNDCQYVDEFVKRADEGEELSYLSYGDIYGPDCGEIVISNNGSNGNGNILVLGDSYDNAIVKLIASHYDNFYAVDLRYYEKNLGKEFDVESYINDNNIDTVLFIGATSLFEKEGLK